MKAGPSAVDPSTHHHLIWQKKKGFGKCQVQLGARRILGGDPLPSA